MSNNHLFAMFIHEFERLCHVGETLTVTLPHQDLVMDPRPNYPRECRFDFIYHDDGITVTLRRIDKGRDDTYYAFKQTFEMRVYNPAIEVVPDFNSTTYTYLGVPGEKAPIETIVGIIDPTVRTIRDFTFSDCDNLKVCIMYDGVETIENDAFNDCTALKVIRLSRSLRFIGCAAFYNCKSLDAIFLPSSLQVIEDEAFASSVNIRILPFPTDMSIRQIGDEIINGCNQLFFATKIQPYRHQLEMTVVTNNGCQVSEFTEVVNNKRVHQSLLDFYHNLPPLHKACLDSNVTAQSINFCIGAYGQHTANITDHNGMTPLHILTMNPNAPPESIVACINANMNAIFIEDARGRTPLDYLWEYVNLEGHILVIVLLCVHQQTI